MPELPWVAVVRRCLNVAMLQNFDVADKTCNAWGHAATVGNQPTINYPPQQQFKYLLFVAAGCLARGCEQQGWWRRPDIFALLTDGHRSKFEAFLLW